MKKVQKSFWIDTGASPRKDAKHLVRTTIHTKRGIKHCYELDPKLIDEIIRRNHDGETINSICRSLGVPRHTLYSLRKRRGIRLKSRCKCKPERFDRATQDAIVAEYDSGSTTTELGKKHGCSHKTVSRVVAISGRKVRATSEYRQFRGDPRFNIVFGYYKCSGSARRFGFTLTKAGFAELVTSDCFYCGRAPAQILKLKKCDLPNLVWNGVDRIDSTKGYHPDNVVTACKRCNWSKHSMSSTEFADWLRRLIANNIFDKLESITKTDPVDSPSKNC